jgi:integrase
MANATPKLEQRKDKNGELIIKNVPILIDFTFDGKRLWLSTGEHVDANKWDSSNNRVKSSVNGSSEINQVIKTKCDEVNKIYREAIIMGKHPSASYIRNCLNAEKATTKKSLTQLYDEFIDGYNIKSSTGTDKKSGTVKKLETNKKHLINFAKQARLSLDFEIIDDIFFNKYTQYFQTQLKHTNGTIAKNIKILKWFLNWASKFGYNKNFAYKSFSVKYQEPEIIILTEAELTTLFELEVGSECLRQVRDVFCFCCYTALRYSDVKNLKKTDIDDDYINITSVKTKSHVSIPLLPQSEDILARYKNLLGTRALPVISNQKMNDYLKDLAKLAKLNRPISKVRYRGSQRIETVAPLHEVLTTHMGRKTFVSLMFRKGVDSELIRSISNHKSISSFARYNKIDDQHKAQAMKLAFKKVS